MAAEVHVNDVGTVVELTFYDEVNNVVDLSGAAVRSFYLKKPIGTVLTKTPSFTTTGSDGKVRYVTIAGDIDTAGVWEVQGYVELASGKFYSSRTQFLVVSNLV